MIVTVPSSGSMTEINTTGAPYDPNKDYSAFGSCDRNNMYYTEDGSTPVCSGDNVSYIDKSSWNCAAADTQIAGAD